MRVLLRPANLFVLTTYLLLSALPFAPLLIGKPVAAPARLLAFEFLAWATVWAVFCRPAWFHWLLLPAFLALPVELYLQVYYHQGISAHHLGIIAETSPRETLEFLGNKIWLLGGVLLGTLGWWWLGWRAALRTRDLDWRDLSRWLALGVMGLAAGLWAYGREAGFRTDPAPSAFPSLASASAPPRLGLLPDTWAQALPALPAWTRLPTDKEVFARSWPFGPLVRLHDFWGERRYLAQLRDKSAQFRFDARSVSDTDQPETYLLVIGESSRYDRWSLNGYARDTTPLLRQEKNLVSLSDMVTAVSATRLSVPVIVSRKPATQSLKAGFAEKSVLSAFREAGFKTFWLSNQMSFGEFDTPVSVFANEADVTQFLNVGGYRKGSLHDEVLLEPLQRALRDPATKKLIVLHTLGNHWNYSHRYPAQFDRWKPSLLGVDNPAYTNLKLKEDISNSYDNSMLYVDWFLSRVIGALREHASIAAMMYVSDHGQTLYDGECRLAFHGHNTQYEFHVPAFVWFADAYRSQHPDKVLRLMKNREEKLSTENVFHSLLDLGNVRYPAEQPERSFLSEKFTRHKRYVDSYGWSDYDNANFSGACREVKDRGTPLKQEK